MTPDYERAAIAATETLKKYNVTSAPVSPLPILEMFPDVLVVTYADMSALVDRSRCDVIRMLGEKNQDACTTVNIHDGKPQYLVTYNQQLPLFLVQRALARELGHIVLGHDGTQPEDVRYEEARAFANHLLCPRPLIHAIQAINLRVTTEVVGNLTGCYDYCLSCMRKLPPVHVPADLNRAVRDQFMPYILNFFNFQRYASRRDGSAIADFGSYMEGYEE